jgi:hypothetical protein
MPGLGQVATAKVVLMSINNPWLEPVFPHIPHEVIYEDDEEDD